MQLATDTPVATFEGSHVVIAAKSGRAVAELAMTPAQAQFLARSLIEASADGFRAQARPLPQAEIIAFRNGN